MSALIYLLLFLLPMLCFADAPSGGATGGDGDAGGGDEGGSESGGDSAAAEVPHDARLSQAAARQSRSALKDRTQRGQAKADAARKAMEVVASEPGKDDSAEESVEPSEEAEPSEPQETEEAAAPEPVRPNQDAGLLQVCHRAGLDPRILDRFTNMDDAISALEIMLERQVAEASTQRERPQAEEEAKPFAFTWPEFPKEYDVDPVMRDYLGGINKQVDALHQYYTGQHAEMKKVIESVGGALRKVIGHAQQERAQKIAESIDQRAASLGAVYEKELGKGPRGKLDPKSRQYQERTRLIQSTVNLMDRLGEPEESAFKLALYRSYGDRAQAHAREETAKAVKEHKKLAVNRPNRGAQGIQDTRDRKQRAMKAVEQFNRDSGKAGGNRRTA